MPEAHRRPSAVRDGKGRRLFLPARPRRPRPHPRRAGTLGKAFVASGLDMLLAVLRLAVARQLVIHSLARTVLVAERPMLGKRMPDVERQLARELELRRRLELLDGDGDRRDRDPRRKLRVPEDRALLDR